MAKTVIYIRAVPYEWSEILQMRRDQQKARRQPQQPTLFEVFDDSRPTSQKKADGRYREPLLFEE